MELRLQLGIGLELILGLDLIRLDIRNFWNVSKTRGGSPNFSGELSYPPTSSNSPGRCFVSSKGGIPPKMEVPPWFLKKFKSRSIPLNFIT